MQIFVSLWIAILIIRQGIGRAPLFLYLGNVNSWVLLTKGYHTCDISRLPIFKELSKKNYTQYWNTVEENFHPLWINVRCLQAIIFVHVSRNLFWGNDLTDRLLPELHAPFPTPVSLQHLHWAWARIHIYETYVDTFPFLGKCINRILMSTCRYYINTKLCILCGCHASFIYVFLAHQHIYIRCHVSDCTSI